MNKVTSVVKNLSRRKHRIRAVVTGTAERPRLTVSISNLHVQAQIIDDTKHKTIVATTTVGRDTQTENMTQKAVWVGSEIGKKAKAAKVKTVVFDRNGKLYHGRIKALADAARQEGLEF